MSTTALIKQLLEAGVHFGHQTKRWNPKMKPFIFGERNGIYIIDLEQTAASINTACDFLRDLTAQGEHVLFVGTKKQAQEAVASEAARCGMFYVTQRWLGGLLTNFHTIKSRMERLKELQTMKQDGTFDVLSKKETSRLGKEMDKLHKNLSGITQMAKLPAAMFVVDPKKEVIAVREAYKLSIPIVGLVDTNCDPDQITHIIPGNDDALKAIRLVVSLVADSIIEGRKALLDGLETQEVKRVKETEGDKEKEEEKTEQENV